MSGSGGVMLAWRRPSWVAAGLGMFCDCWGATPRPSIAEKGSWMIRPHCRRDGFEKKGGRKSYLASTPHLAEGFLSVIDTCTAGDPMQEGVLWTNLTRSEIAAGLAWQGFVVS